MNTGGGSREEVSTRKVSHNNKQQCVLNSSASVTRSERSEPPTTELENLLTLGENRIWRLLVLRERPYRPVARGVERERERKALLVKEIRNAWETLDFSILPLFFSSSSLQLSTPLLTCRTRDGGTQRTKWRCFAHTKDGGRKTCVTYSILWIEVVCIRCNRLNDERQKVSHAPSCVCVRLMYVTRHCMSQIPK